MHKILASTDTLLDKAVGGVGYVEDHQSPIEYLHRDDIGIGKFGPSAAAMNL
jgi:hypothetical protein